MFNLSYSRFRSCYSIEIIWVINYSSVFAIYVWDDLFKILISLIYSYYSKIKSGEFGEMGVEGGDGSHKIGNE